MKTMEFSVDINAAKERVWFVLWDHELFRDWSDIIDEGMYYEGELTEGNEVQFISSVNGAGVTSLVQRLIPEEFIQFQQMNDTQGYGKEDRDKQWTGSKESYELVSNDGVTTLTLISDIPPELEEMMSERMPKALERIKVLSENTQD